MKYRDFSPHDPLPADFADALNEFISTAAPNFSLIIKPSDATVLQVPAAAGNGQVAIGIQKVSDTTKAGWRYVTSTVERASPGGSAQTFDVFVTSTDNVFIPGDPEVDNTVYTFALAIVATGTTPSGVALARKVATAVWDGSQFTAVDVLVGAQSGTARHAATHSTTGDDPVTPASIGAATEADLLTEASARTSGDASNANIPTAGQKAALAGTDGSPGSGDKYVTDSDPRNANTRTPTDNTVSTAKLQDSAVTSVKIADGTIATADLADGAVTSAKIADGTITAADLAAAVQAALFATGDLKAGAYAAAPTGWALCDGSLQLRAGTFAALFAVIGVLYGSGNGTTTFNLPDFRGRVLVGADGAAGRLSANDGIGNASGEETHMLTSGESGVPAHTHPLTGHTVTDGALSVQTGATPIATVATDAATATQANAPASAASAHNNMPPYQVVSWFVKL